MGEVEAPHYGKEGLGWLRKKLFWNFSPEILSPLIGAALKQGSVTKQPVIVIVIVNVIVNFKSMGTYEDHIIPIKISQLARYVAKVKKISLDDALVYIYVNPMYKRLYDEKAKWWYLSTEALYEEFESWRKRQTLEIPREVFEFYTYCLENYAISKNINGLSAWTVFKESDADKYIIDNYDLLHTQGLEYLLDNIQRFIKKRKR